jgi:hypothetical protein
VSGRPLNMTVSKSNSQTLIRRIVAILLRVDLKPET